MTTQRKIKGFLAASFLGAASSLMPATAQVRIANPLPTQQNQFTLQNDFINSVINLARQLHVDKAKSADEEKIIAGAINGALKTLDPFSSYMTPKEWKEMQDSSRGEFSGVGMTLGVVEGALTITTTIKNTPSFKAGAKTGDKITHINGQPARSMTADEAVQLIRGKINTPVTIDVERNGQKLKFKMIRDVIRTPALESGVVDKDIGYIRINTFMSQTLETQLYDAIHDMDSKGQIKSYVIDLRNNPGGYLQAATQMSDAFIDSKQLILSSEGRDKNHTQHYYATPGDRTDGKPIVVLINSGSASASELLAGALQDTGRATILGTQSFGKGTVQSIIPLSTGGALKITTSRYLTPSGRSIQNHGITPDILYVPHAGEDKEVRQSAADNPDSLANLDAPGKDKTFIKSTCTAADQNAKIAKELHNPVSEKIDYTLLCAVETLRRKSNLTVTAPYTAKPATTPAPKP